MSTAMTWLARLGKDHMFLWAWGINGCFSVIGAALVPIIATSFGLPPCWRSAVSPICWRCRPSSRCCCRSPPTPSPASAATRHDRGEPALARLGAALALAGLLLPQDTACAPAPNARPAPLPTRRPSWSRSRFRRSPIAARCRARKAFLDVADGSGAATPRRAAGSIGRTRPTATAACCCTFPGLRRAPAGLMVVFFHGNNATLARDVRNRQPVPRQVTESGLNAVLVAPQFALNAPTPAPGGSGSRRVRGFVREAGDRLTGFTAIHARAAIQSLPVVVAAYSGGYAPAASASITAGPTIACAASSYSMRSTPRTTSSLAWLGGLRPSSSAPSASQPATRTRRCSAC